MSSSSTRPATTAIAPERAAANATPSFSRSEAGRRSSSGGRSTRGTTPCQATPATNSASSGQNATGPGQAAAIIAVPSAAPRTPTASPGNTAPSAAPPAASTRRAVRFCVMPPPIITPATQMAGSGQHTAIAIAVRGATAWSARPAASTSRAVATASR